MTGDTSDDAVDVSVIIPVFNGEQWIDECLSSVAQQEFDGTLEVSIYDDSSTDGTAELLREWKTKLESRGFLVRISSGDPGSKPRGVGFAKNAAVRQSKGWYLCFQDIDDVMHPSRVQEQFCEATKQLPNTIVGSQYHRLPEGSTERYTLWANTLDPRKLTVQVYTSHGPTVIMPTWFCSRAVFDVGTPEDLIFFYKHLDLGGNVARVEKDLLTYRYHPQQSTFTIAESTIWDLRLARLKQRVLAHWPSFTIWNAGKQGRRFYRSLDVANRKKVSAFCDVDEKKISRGVYIHEESEEVPRPRVPIIHFKDATPPLVICMKLDLTNGSFEANLSSLNLIEGVDYVHFS
ncbi:queuosine-tRNA galactosyltransferase isoform X2 [Rhipicephalus microplus]|uniref:queuosine-tRNA galactosyltransferase isoform X2 n=1 Tax=Rhipicephalus microplus TaxID=6941 RepID=UPI001887BC6B|nr:UDP-GlcNAc:betaGal beta-1,3-N-acetylglucosaminyltransferase-like protein 1 isoform X3 [Rhipicephalus microplus]